MLREGLTLVTSLIAPSIAGGIPTQEFPAVVYLNEDCTATFISARTLLTAAHCFKSKGLFKDSGNEIKTQVRIKGGYHGQARVVFRSHRINPVATPDYYELLSSKMDETVDFDQVLVILPKPQSVQPLPICRVASSAGDPVTMVGYGFDMDYRPETTDFDVFDRESAGIRRKGVNSIHRIQDEVIFIKGITMTLDHRPSRARNITQGGDSGGPIIREDGCITGTVIGRHRAGWSGIREPVEFEGVRLEENEAVTLYQRVDSGDARAWITQWVE